ncbi:MAG: hypothetical protein AAF483_16990 [Planctomycetota bacterium]
MPTSDVAVLLVTLLILLGIAVVALITFSIAYSILSRRMSHKLQLALTEMELALEGRRLTSTASHHGVPPMRIHLEFADEDESLFGSRGLLAAKWFDANGFRFLGQYVVEEMQEEKLRAFAHRELPVLASLRYPVDEALPYVEFAMLESDCGLVGVANPPKSTLQLPDGVPGMYFFEDLSIDLMDRMWCEAQEIVDSLQCGEVPQDRQGFAELYEQAHASEMDSRLRCGGLSEREIIETFRQQGILASPSDIDTVQQQWQAAIEEHLLDFSSKTSNCFYSGRSVLIVHEGSQQGYLISRLGELLAGVDSKPKSQRDEIMSIFKELAVLLHCFSPREAIERFRALLPSELRYDLVDQLNAPVEADCYMLPENSVG